MFRLPHALSALAGLGAAILLSAEPASAQKLGSRLADGWTQLTTDTGCVFYWFARPGPDEHRAYVRGGTCQPGGLANGQVTVHFQLENYPSLESDQPFTYETRWTGRAEGGVLNGQVNGMSYVDSGQGLTLKGNGSPRTERFENGCMHDTRPGSDTLQVCRARPLPAAPAVQAPPSPRVARPAPQTPPPITGPSRKTPAPAASTPVVRATPQEVARIMEEIGLEVSFEEPGDAEGPSLSAFYGDTQFLITFEACDANGEECELIVFRCGFMMAPEDQPDLETLNVWNSTKWGKAMMDDEGDVWVILEVNTVGGITEDNLLDTFSWWEGLTSEFIDFIGFES